MRSELKFLGFDLTQEGIKIPQEYINSIMKLPIPHTEKQLRTFLNVIIM